VTTPPERVGCHSEASLAWCRVTDMANMQFRQLRKYSEGVPKQSARPPFQCIELSTGRLTTQETFALTASIFFRSWFVSVWGRPKGTRTQEVLNVIHFTTFAPVENCYEEGCVRGDPLGYRSGMSLHEYVGGHPIIKVDPSGLIDIPMDQEWPPRPPGKSTECMFSLYDDRDSLSYQLHCSARYIDGEGGSIPMGGRRVKSAVDAARDRSCCIKRLSILDHGGALHGQCVGPRDPSLDSGDVTSLCESLCDGATVDLYGCKVGSGNGNDPSVKALKECKKIKAIHACTGFVHHACSPCGWSIRWWASLPYCEGMWRSL
jgi:hypothetical protein